MIAGLDPSTRKLAFVGCTTKRTRAWSQAEPVLHPGRAYDADVAASIFDITYRVVTERSIEKLYIEAPLLGRAGVKTAVILGYVGGAAHAGASYAGAEVVIVQVQRWKATLGSGFGNMDKAKVCDRMEQLWPSMYERVAGDQDLVDASAICWHAVHTERLAAVA